MGAKERERRAARFNEIERKGGESGGFNESERKGARADGG